MNPLISVIVPVYNVEKYLDRCVESIVNQTYKNLEIILVDDGSTDNCPQKCDDWAKKDNRIIVIHKENGGLSDARNIGMQTAKGEYIGFVDSDDFLDERMYQIMFDIILQTHSDVAECKWTSFYKTSEIVYAGEGNIKRKFEVFDTESALRELILEKKLKQTVVNKLYKKTSINVQFPKGRINEDDFWTYKVFGNSQKIVYIDIVLYFYYQRINSIMHNKYSVKRLDGVFARKERMQYVIENYNNIKDYAILSYIWTCFYNYQVICRNKDIDKKSVYRKFLHKEYCDNFSIDCISLKSKKQQLWMKGFKCFPNLTCTIRNFLKIGL